MAIKIAFVGGNEMCLNLIKYIEKVPSFQIVMVADQFRDSPALRYASERQLRVTTNILEAVKYPDLDVLMELTSNQREVTEIVKENLLHKTAYFNSAQSEMLFTIFASIINNEFLKIEERFIHNIKDIKKSITDFATITKNIDILAINASIEAARAGEAGKGFAVVASSIKDLVKNSRDTLQYIKIVLEKLTLIHKDMKETRGALKHGRDEEAE